MEYWAVAFTYKTIQRQRRGTQSQGISLYLCKKCVGRLIVDEYDLSAGSHTIFRENSLEPIAGG